MERPAPALLIVLASVALACGGRGPSAPTGGPPTGGLPSSPAPAPSPTPSPAPTPTPPSAPTPSPSPPVMVEGLVLDGYVFPIHQFNVAGPDTCDEAHYHSRIRVCSIGTLGIFDLIICHPSLDSGENDEEAIQREVVYKPDPDPGGCGFGKVSQVRKASSVVSYICAAYWDANC